MTLCNLPVLDRFDLAVLDLDLYVAFRRQFIVVRHDDQRHALLAVVTKEQFLDFFARDAVEITSWLIGKYNIWIDNKSSCNCDSL